MKKMLEQNCRNISVKFGHIALCSTQTTASEPHIGTIITIIEGLLMIRAFLLNGLMSGLLWLMTHEAKSELLWIPERADWLFPHLHAWLPTVWWVNSRSKVCWWTCRFWLSHLNILPGVQQDFDFLKIIILVFAVSLFMQFNSRYVIKCDCTFITPDKTNEVFH